MGITHFCGIILDIKDDYRFGRLFENLPISVYQLDADDKFVKINEAAEELLGYKSEELEKTDVRDIFVNPDVADENKKDIMKPPYKFINKEVELYNKGGKKIWVRLNTFKIPQQGELYYGRQGSLYDITDSVWQKKLMQFPVGFYVVETKNKRHSIEHCNSRFAEIFGYENEHKVIGKDPIIFFSSKEEYDTYINKLMEADTNPLLGHVFNAKKKDGSTFKTEISSQIMRDKNGTITGRVGVIRKIDAEIELREKVTEISYDIGAILHNYSTILILIHSKMESIAEYIDHDVQDKDKELNTDLANKEIKRLLNNLTYSMQELNSIINALFLQAKRDIALKKELTRLNKDIKTYIDVQNPILIIPRYKEFVLILRAKLHSIASYNIPVDAKIIDTVLAQIDSFLRYSSIVSIHEINDVVVTIESQVRNFRQAITQNIKEEWRTENKDICQIVRKTLSNHRDFANHFNTELRDEFRVSSALISINALEIERSLSSIVHNAIKYSWNRLGHDKRWIDIKITEEVDWVIIEVINYGTAIHKKELEDELIFKVGYRGIVSNEQGRIGTGYGLNDARNIIENKHKGQLIITSVPADKVITKINYSRPFITNSHYKT